MFNNIPKQFSINDERDIKSFSKQTYNGYKKTTVINELKKNIISGNLEKSGFWAAELHCSGYIYNLYNTLFTIYIKDVNKSNLNILKIFNKELKDLYIKKKNFKDLLFLRNDQYYRNHLHNIVAYLTLSPKYKLPTLPKINQEDFVMKNNKSKIISNNLTDIKKIITKHDPKEVIIPLSEILVNLKHKGLSKSLENCIFWTSWLLTYDNIFHKKKLKCGYRQQKNIKKDYCHDFTWIIWEIIFTFQNKPLINLLYELYIFEFTLSKKKNKANILILAYMLLIDPFPKIKYDFEFTDNKKITLNTYLANINFLYSDILKNKSTHNVKNIPDTKINTNNNNSNSIFSDNKYKSCDINHHIKMLKKNNKKKIFKNKKNNNYVNKIVKPDIKKYIKENIKNKREKEQNKKNSISKKRVKFELENFIF